jgi:hypothetical protein
MKINKDKIIGGLNYLRWKLFNVYIIKVKWIKIIAQTLIVERLYN